MPIFVSYSHKQAESVHQCVIPVLRAAGAEVLVDIDHFKAGQTVIGQMNKLQDTARRHLLLITSDYLESDYCRHEMDQAIKADPAFAASKVLVVKLDDTPLPPELSGTGSLGSGPLYVDLKDTKNAASWDLLLQSADLALAGTDAPNWLSAFDQTKKHLERRESINLVVGTTIKWQTWQQQLIDTRFPKLGVVDLRKPGTIPREGLVTEILKATSGPLAKPVPPPPHDLPLLADNLCNGGPYHILLSHFDLINAPERAHYTDELARSLRWFCMEDRSLVLVVQTRSPVANVLPANEFDSWPDFKTVELG